jgi:hypothetical protein
MPAIADAMAGFFVVGFRATVSSTCNNGLCGEAQVEIRKSAKTQSRRRPARASLRNECHREKREARRGDPGGLLCRLAERDFSQ